jgi:SAM-dependent methyltransferase
MTMAAGTSIGAANAAFWNELCSSVLARSLGIIDDSPASLARFDRWYFDFYPYLAQHIPFTALSGKRVLEVGLGYGSVAQRLAEAGVVYHGLDIAAGPVAMVQHRLAQKGLTGDVRQGSVLACPWPDASFDHVVAIGCYHHTGDPRRALVETRRVLRPGGGTTIMVYAAYSYRRCARWPIATARRWLAERAGGPLPPASAAERAAYDADTSGRAAPETAFVSGVWLRNAMRDWRRVEIASENIGTGGLFRFLPRRFLLAALGPWCGLDLYVRAVN